MVTKFQSSTSVNPAYCDPASADENKRTEASAKCPKNPVLYHWDPNEMTLFHPKLHCQSVVPTPRRAGGKTCQPQGPRLVCGEVPAGMTGQQAVDEYPRSHLE